MPPATAKITKGRIIQGICALEAYLWSTAGPWIDLWMKLPDGIGLRSPAVGRSRNQDWPLIVCYGCRRVVRGRTCCLSAVDESEGDVSRAASPRSPRARRFTDGRYIAILDGGFESSERLPSAIPLKLARTRLELFQYRKVPPFARYHRCRSRHSLPCTTGFARVLWLVSRRTRVGRSQKATAVSSHLRLRSTRARCPPPRPQGSGRKTTKSPLYSCPAASLCSHPKSIWLTRDISAAMETATPIRSKTRRFQSVCP